MKRIILLIGFLVCAVPALYPRAAEVKAEAEKVWERANTLYINGDYVGAAAFYEAIVDKGYISGRLFYNLGNAYFKAGELGRAVLNYNRAQKLMPYDKDVTYNLAVANGYVKDKIDTVPEFFLSRWIKAWRSSLDSNTWAARSLVLLAVALAGVLVFPLEERSGWRKSAPEKEGSDIFILHEGTKVEVLSSYDGWTEIMIADGNKGWVPADSVELITY